MKKLLKNKVFKNFTYLAAIQAFTYLTPLIVIPYLYKVIGVQKYGLFAFSNSFVFYFIIAVDFGFQLYATKEIASKRNDQDYVNRLFSAIYLVKLFLFLASALIYFGLICLVPMFRSELPIYLYAFLQVAGFFLLPIWVFQGFEEIRPLTIVNVVTRVFFLSGVLLLIREKTDYAEVQLLNSISILAYGALSFLIAKKRFALRFVPVTRSLVNEVVAKSAWYFGARVATSCYTVSNTIFLGFSTDTTNVGLYSVAERFYFAIQNLLQPITSAIYPHIASTRNLEPIKKFFLPAFLVFFAGCVAAMLLASPLLHLLISDIDPVSITVFKILCVVLIVTFPSLMLGYPVTAALGHDKLANTPLFAVSIFHILALSIFYFFGWLSPLNIAVLLLITESILLALRIYIVYRLQLFKYAN